MSRWLAKASYAACCTVLAGRLGEEADPEQLPEWVTPFVSPLDHYLEHHQAGHYGADHRTTGRGGDDDLSNLTPVFLRTPEMDAQASNALAPVTSPQQHSGRLELDEDDEYQEDPFGSATTKALLVRPFWF